MRWTTGARVLIALLAVATSAGLLALDREHDRCDEAARGAFLASKAPAALLQGRIDRLIEDCAGAERLTQIAVGLSETRPRAAVPLARAAAEREPDSYPAWAVLAVAAPPAEARAAARRARELNPLSADAGP